MQSMKTLLPKRPNPTVSEPTTFGQKRAEDFSKRYQKKIEERRKLARAQHAAGAVPDKELETAFAQKGERVGRDIGRMQDEINQDNDDKNT